MAFGGDRSARLAYIAGKALPFASSRSMNFLSTRVALLAIFLIATFSIHQQAYGQGEFVARGANGLMLGGEVTPEGDRTSYTATAGFSVKGRLDLRLGYAWMDSMADTLAGHITGRGLRPGLNLHLIKQGNRYPFSLSAIGRYQRSEWDAETIGAEEVTGTMFEVGGMLHTIFQVAEFAGLRPWFGIVHQNRDREYIIPDEPVVNVEGDDTRYMTGIQVVVMPTDRSVFFVGPAISMMAGERTVGVSGGLVVN